MHCIARTYTRMSYNNYMRESYIHCRIMSILLHAFHTTVTCNSYIRQLHAIVTCNSYMQQLHATVTCNSYMHHFHAIVTCNSYMQQLHATVTYNSYMQQLHALHACHATTFVLVRQSLMDFSTFHCFATKLMSPFLESFVSDI